MTHTHTYTHTSTMHKIGCGKGSEGVCDKPLFPLILKEATKPFERSPTSNQFTIYEQLE